MGTFMVACIVVDEKVQHILGPKAAQQIKLVTVHTENIAAVDEYEPISMKDIESKYPSLFVKRLVLLNENVKLKLDARVSLVQNPIRRVPHALMDNLQAELTRLEKAEIIERTTKPTEWLSSVVTVTKPQRENTGMHRSTTIKHCTKTLTIHDASARRYPTAATWCASF